ncbi:scavenger receptor cysteine-rich type 1 protein M160-like, partial [Brachionichthys hirsutus]|uniref:scavenger receptor cysteine-rich type 1 protein M160-like n=1 Tax=Brachionichthys hirsutus TaxID=412623 RepID=UPI0036044032
QAYVVCAGSVDVRLADGPGRCAGRVEVQYTGQWRRADKKGWTDTNSDVVCKQLKCGNKRKSPYPGDFSQGSGDFLAKAVNCSSNALHISECVNFSKAASGEKFMIAITCEKHIVVFLKANRSCSGMVGIEQGGIPYWLSGSKETWNLASANTVCRQMSCRKALEFNSVPSTHMKGDIWIGSYECSSNNASLFECKNATLPSDHYDTIATVECSGNISVTLSNSCWGNVNACVEGNCGNVCEDTWTKHKSSMLCENLNCGIPIRTNGQPGKGRVIIKSVHLTNHTTNLNQCNLVLNSKKDTSCDHKPAYVVCSGSLKTRITASRQKCFGTVEMYSEGQWLPVCVDALRDNVTQKIICMEEKCGEAVNVNEHFGPKTAWPRVISQIQCLANNSDSFKACTMTSDWSNCTQGVLQCSGWRKMELKFGKACSGAVFVHSEKGRQAVSSEGWTEAEGNRLCQDLKCGNFKFNTSTKFNYFWNGSFNCEGVKDPMNIWACEKPALSAPNQLNIECDDEPKITLSEKCAGEVKINNISVCSSHWNMDYSFLVCQEHGCIGAISFDSTPPNPKETYHHVSCEDYHHNLGQCNRYMSKCDGGLVSIVCAGDLKFKTTENCGGQIQVNYRNQWEKVCLLSFPAEQKEKLCHHLLCPGHNDSLAIPNRIQLDTESLETALDCTNDYNFKYCVKSWSCGSLKPAEIYCNGYERKTPVLSRSHKVSIILGAGLILVLVVVILFVCIKTASKSALSNKKVEPKSRKHDDVSRGAEKGHHKFRSEAECMMEAGTQSISSYDDIDETFKAQPLSFQATTAAIPRENYFYEDGATCEVDGLEEAYDDIDGCPEILQAKAEIHSSPQNAPETVALAHLGLMREGED